MNLFELTRSLIDIPSVSGEESRVAEFIATHLRGLGYSVELQETVPERPNVIAHASGRPRVVFSTHLDTVPPFIGASEDEDAIYGRGACDAKGIIAAQIIAAESLRADGIEEVGLLFTVDEELGSLGARAANLHPLAQECQFIVNGEPTDNQLAVGSKGSLRLRLTSHGRAAHSSYPENGVSAIEKLLDALQSVREVSWPADGFFGDTTCNIGTLAGGTRPNVIPAEASAELQIRLAINSERVKERLEQAVSDRADIEYLSLTEPVRLLDVDGFDHTVVRFTTDIPHLSNWGEALLLGPGSILDAHTSHEKVSKRELEKSVELYARLARKLLRT